MFRHLSGLLLVFNMTLGIVMAKRIMVCGADKTLVETRRAILAKAGYKVFACMSAGESRSEIKSSEVDLLVLCSSLSREQQCQLLDISHKVRPGEKSLVRRRRGFGSRRYLRLSIFRFMRSMALRIF